jgi:predicted DsbA family dithiol-disulfide isomerase
MVSKPELRVSVFSDYVCPFCYLGSRRLMSLDEDFDLYVNWCGLEIHPEVPQHGMPLEELGYTAEAWRALLASMERLAAEDGLDLRLPPRVASSRKALLLSEAAKEAGRSAFYRLHHALFRACFEHGRDIGDPGVLRELAGEAGLSAVQVDCAWSEARFGQRLAMNRRFALELGIAATPTYVFGRRLVRGAVEVAELRHAARASLSAAAPR